MLKVLAPPTGADHPWAGSDDPRHWNHWRREALAYTHDLPAAYRGTGLDAPRLLHLDERPDGDIALWLEDVPGPAGTACGVRRLAVAAHSLGRAQGRCADAPPAHPWLSRGFLRDYSGSRPVDRRAVDDERAWATPLVRATLPPALRPAWRRMTDHRDELLAICEGLPRTLCHLDMWPRNLIARDAGRTAVIDWGFAGDGAVGEDLGTLIPDAFLDGFLPAAWLGDLDRLATRAYLTGLRQAGWRGDPRHARLAVNASAVKFDWLLPAMLARAVAGDHRGYGGGDVDATALYRNRAPVLTWLADRAAQALRAA